MEKSLASNNNLLIKQILDRLIQTEGSLRQIENRLDFIQQYINQKKAREDARWFF